MIARPWQRGTESEGTAKRAASSESREPSWRRKPDPLRTHFILSTLRGSCTCNNTQFPFLGKQAPSEKLIGGRMPLQI